MAVLDLRGSTAPRGALLARRPELVPAAAVGLVMLLTSGRYGYHRDELYFLEAGRHLAWGYPDQPPLVPVVARVMSTVAPDSLVALRLRRHWSPPSWCCSPATWPGSWARVRPVGRSPPPPQH